MSRFLALATDSVLSFMVALTVFLAVTGGGRLSVAGANLSATDWKRPAVAAFALFLVRVLVLWRRSDRAHRLQHLADNTALVGFAALLVAMPALWLHYLVKACGGLDSHGYVSASALITAGTLVVPQPIADWLPIQNAIDAVAPLGYVASPDGHHIVPRFPLGLPLVMAFFRMAFGPNGVFYVSPVLAIGTIALIGLLVARRTGALSGVLAAVLVGAHPLFFTYAIQPMSDVPATFWLVLAVLVIDRTPHQGWLAGIAAGLAMLTRPPLALAGIVLPAFLAREHNRSTIATFLLGFLSCALVFFALQWTLYGGLLHSGYGTPGVLFSPVVIPYNLVTYGKWLLLVFTPVLPLAVAAGWRLADREFALQACVVFLAVALPYILYTNRFDDWEMLRFLLPGVVFLVMVSAQGIVALFQRALPTPLVSLAALVMAIAASVASFTYLQNRDVFRLWLAESKYPIVGMWFTMNTNDRAVVLAALHSGSVHYYSGRQTIRWDVVPREDLAPAIAAIAAQGHTTFLVFDGYTERKEFTDRFGALGQNGVQVEFVGRYRDIDIARVSP